MIPSYVTRMPKGDETGTFLSLDLGGSNLRVSAVELLGQGQVQVAEVKRIVTDDLRTGAIDSFFDWMADAVHDLLLQQHIQLPTNDPLAMGVCWSFPVAQTSIIHGKILRMGKGFTLEGIEGQDLAGLFHQAFARKALNIVVTALVNDTVGTLVAHAYSHPGACIGFIYGTGVNASYPEKISRIGKLHMDSGSISNLSEQHAEQEQSNDAIMLVNTEIDLFGNESYLPLTPFDKALDQQHSQPNFQAYEKMMSGAYLGELARLVIVSLTIEHKVLFGGHLPPPWKEPWSLTTTWMSEMESMQDNEQRLAKFNEWIAIKSSDNDHPPTTIGTSEDMEQLMQVCTMISTRAATLASAAMAAIIEQQGLLVDGDGNNINDPIIIGVNGSTFEKYPQMQQRIYSNLRSWFGDQIAARIQVDLAKDGSSIGGALIAMLYHPR
ncbi:actin-like ATPase domain-containing protein [Lichtheimia hyalospora FSU 10163]|nr:actin-like ATPase domain-containing protein [Lichtheimia hyalospora FSU 10163]